MKIVTKMPSFGLTPINGGYPRGLTTEEKALAMKGKLSVEEARQIVKEREEV